jgi:hypothetical protein
MSVHVETNSYGDAILVAFDERMDAHSRVEYIDEFDRIPRIRGNTLRSSCEESTLSIPIQ